MTLRRLIEVALPLKEVSEQSAREKSIRHGHISTLHIWWARRPLAACRAVVFASLIPDPDDPACPPEFRSLVDEQLEFLARPRAAWAAAQWNARHAKQIEQGLVEEKRAEDFLGDYTGRALVLEFIKELVKWENSNDPRFIEPARRLIAAAHRFLHLDSRSEMPKVLDPFAGGGAIPLEALRLGCEAHAIELNPVAHLIELCTLVYPQKYGRPNSRPTPHYIKVLEAAHRANSIGEDLFDHAARHAGTKERTDAGTGSGGQDGGSAACGSGFQIDGVDLARLPRITEAEYRKNPLAADVKFWGRWVLEKARDEIGRFYPHDSDGAVPVAYLWARTVKCPNPACGATIPLVRQLWLCKKRTRKVAMRMIPDPRTKRCRFEVVAGKQIDFDPDQGTMASGKAACPFCGQVADGEYLRAESKARHMGQQLIGAVTVQPNEPGKRYRAVAPADEAIFAEAEKALAEAKRANGDGIVPDEPITPDRPSPNSRGLSAVARYGFDNFGMLFNARQALALTTFVRYVRRAIEHLRAHEEEYAKAVGSYLACVHDRLVDKAGNICVWNSPGEKLEHVFGRQALPMVWDYGEVNPFSGMMGDWLSALEWVYRALVANSHNMHCATCSQASATSMPLPDASIAAVITDPPYYDAVPYADLSDFFYVWLKRTVGDLYPDVFRTPLTPKRQELIAYYGPGKRRIQKPPEWYEQGMAEAFAEMHRVLDPDGICAVMFAHKTTSAWESIIAALIRSGLTVTSSWPLHTEMKTRMVARNAAALASSVTLICRKRAASAEEGYWEDVRSELRQVARERLDFFWKQGIRGADFFISAIGPALSVFGRYSRVSRLTGKEVTVRDFLDEVRQIVTDYALSQILHGAKTGQIDAETRFYVLWKWSYGDAKVPADEAFKLAQAFGIGTEQMWDRTGVLIKQGENIQALPIEKRMRIRDLGEPNADGSPASLIDVLHRCCAYRQKGDAAGLAEFLGRSGHARNESLWRVAQAISEVLPEGDKEKQLLQGLLNQRDRVETAIRQERLF